MSVSPATASRRERRAAAALGGKRVKRAFGPTPDTTRIKLPCGAVVQPEVKTRARLPHIVTAAWDQARRYSPNAIPVAVIFRSGLPGGLVALDLDAFAGLVGLDVDALPKPTPLRRKSTRQMDLFA